MNIFLRQEIDRLQRVITAVRSICSDLKLAIDGTIIMSEQMSDALNQIYDARIPGVWSKISWASSTLGFWFTELVDRHAQERFQFLDFFPRNGFSVNRRFRSIDFSMN